MKRLNFLILLVALPLLAQAQEVEREVYNPHNDTLFTSRHDSLVITEGNPDAIQVLPKEAWRPDPYRAVWMGAIIPGYGQIHNRSYWKLPIVYGAFMGCAYAITWTNRQYTDYKTAYRDILVDPNYDPEDASKSYVAILPTGYTVDRMGGRSRYTTTLQTAQNNYRRYRDISIVATVIVYALSLIDAYVDAQLFDFDISPDLSLNLMPDVPRDPLGTQQAELKIAVRF
ncbi:MAG: hypothetical protein IJV55_03880 [Paludibacteraceae bacterium]|nr:hypothetical protein [Paludibacteraceae bacterium]MBQ9705315.1 hypothetical protein [Paludibacteraceae bacterium]